MLDHISRPETLGFSPGSGFIEEQLQNNITRLGGKESRFFEIPLIYLFLPDTGREVSVSTSGMVKITNGNRKDELTSKALNIFLHSFLDFKARVKKPTRPTTENKSIRKPNAMAIHPIIFFISPCELNVIGNDFCFKKTLTDVLKEVNKVVRPAC